MTELPKARIDCRICSVWRRTEASELDRSIVLRRERVRDRCTVDRLGLAGDQPFPRYPRSKIPMKNDPFCRAMLVQARQHYTDLQREFPALESSFSGDDSEFGENLVVDSVAADTVCIGDVFASNSSPLQLQVTSPRLCCMRPDKRHPTYLPSGSEGTVRKYASSTARGGWFCKVLESGDIADGDVLKLVSRSNPSWTVQRVAATCYSSTPMRLSWAGTRAELEELYAIKDLAPYEWRDALREVIDTQSESGDGTLDNVGIKLNGTFTCADCNQRFLTKCDLKAHVKFVHDPKRHFEH